MSVNMIHQNMKRIQLQRVEREALSRISSFCRLLEKIDNLGYVVLLFLSSTTLQMDKRERGQWRIERQQIFNIIQNEHSWKSYCLAFAFNVQIAKEGKSATALLFV